MMNTINKLFCATLLVAGFSACASEFDNDFQVHTKPATVTEAEQLSTYNTLLEYVGSNFAIGNTLTSAEFLKESTPTSITQTNFNELTVSDAFLHSKLVNSLGEVDVTSALNVIDLAAEKNLKLYGGTLVSSNAINESYLTNILPGKLAEDSVLYDFEDVALGYKYPMASNASPTSGIAEIRNDPEGINGKSLYVEGSISFPVVTFDLPKGKTLGDFIRIEMDWYAVNGGGLNGFANALHVLVQEEPAKDYATPGAQGCKLKEWGRVSLDLTVSGFDDRAGLTSVPLEFGPVDWGAQWYADNIKWIYTYNVPDYDSDESKAPASEAMKIYVQAIVKTYSENVPAWTIADRPVSSPSTMYWKRVLGDTYFGKAAQYAREVNPALKLFVSEEGLDDASRLADLIAVIKKAESEGAKIDGIEVLLDAKNVDQSALSAMFKTLAGTGKLIRLTGLEVSGSDDATDATALKTVLSLYKQIPEAQRYGVTFNNAVGELWDSKYNRRQTYAGVAEGL